jgi:hypothetical protein
MRGVKRGCTAAGAMILVLLSNVAYARALETYEKGEYLAAAEEAAQEGGGPGFALAARATLADATLREMPCMPCLQKAEDYARRAIAADANYAEGYIELAIALGYEARLMGLLRARLNRFGEQAKDAIDMALQLKPDDPWAQAAAGGWNIEVVRLAGRVLASVLYGARFDEGIAHYRKALGADSSNLIISLQYALSLTSYAFEARRSEIAAVLDATAHGKAQDAYSEAIRGRAAKLLNLLESDKRADFLALARKYLGIP